MTPVVRFTRAGLLLSSICGALASTSTYQTEAEQALQALQTFYNNDTGLYNAFWWQTPNALTTLANMVSLNSSYAREVADFVFPNTYKQAMVYDAQHGYNVKRQTTGFEDHYYDDEGWWALAWIHAYHATGNETYLAASESLFQDMTTGWGTNCSSQGLWWDRDPHTQINSIANSLFLETAAALATLVPQSKTTYIGWAEKTWDYFISSGMYNTTTHLTNGGLQLSTCKALPSIKAFTYNQGSLLQGLTILAHATGNQSYLDEAKLIAEAVIDPTSAYIDNYILTEPGVGQSASLIVEQFKGVFMRGLQRLNHASPSQTYAQFAVNQSNSIWNNDRESGTFQLGNDWSGPFYGPANASQQSSAMDALVAAWATTTLS